MLKQIEINGEQMVCLTGNYDDLLSLDQTLQKLKETIGNCGSRCRTITKALEKLLFNTHKTLLKKKNTFSRCGMTNR
jgi:hypothetical protein